MMKKISIINVVFLSIILMVSCKSEKNKETVIPKDFGALRVSHKFLPKAYTQESEMCGMSFTLPNYAELRRDGLTDSTCFYTFEIPKHKASIHLAHINITSQENLRLRLKDAYKLIGRHLLKADDVRDTVILNQEHKTYARVQNLIGNVAEPIQFTITDSLDHFIFGRLIFDARPNYDSILPALNYVRDDIYHFVNTLEWNAL